MWAIIRRDNSAVDSMSVSAVSGAIPQYLAPQTPQAKSDDERTESILREHLQLSKEEWDALNYTDLHFSGEEAVNIGLVHEIGEFSPPPGSQIWDI